MLPVKINTNEITAIDQRKLGSTFSTAAEAFFAEFFKEPANEQVFQAWCEEYHRKKATA